MPQAKIGVIGGTWHYGASKRGEASLLSYFPLPFPKGERDLRVRGSLKMRRL